MIVVEPRLEITMAPWTAGARVTCLEVGPGGRRDAPAEVKRGVAMERLRTFTDQCTWIWADRSAEAGVTRGVGGAHILTVMVEETEVSVAARQHARAPGQSSLSSERPSRQSREERTPTR